MILAIWNCFSIPFFVALEPTIADEPSMFGINTAIDILFAVDIALNFRTTYFNVRTGDEVFDTNKIATNYFVTGRFFIDLLASIPVDIVMQLILGEN